MKEIGLKTAEKTTGKIAGLAAKHKTALKIVAGVALVGGVVAGIKHFVFPHETEYVECGTSPVADIAETIGESIGGDE